ncbi:unnamed protein product [Moneuplotes crassus]|uniref:Uncharacterized protein n=1 Tax=Euplotes crassus TaxID=5936 RepID=A0AAD1UF94_EUPCR|nr:unnamed protein product [Moneuplotes crassus]
MEISDKEKITVDNLLENVSKRFQVFSTIVHAIGFCMGGFLSFALPLVELFPQFQCYDATTGGYTNCSRQEACDSHNWAINWEEERSIKNWISDMNIYCIEKWKIGLFGSMYYFGYLLGSIVFVNVSDMYGRKICTRVSYIGHTIAFFFIIFISNLYTRYACIFLCGFVGSVRCSVSYTTGCEFLQKRYQIWSSTVTQMINACVPMFLAIYFWKITDYWIYFFLFTLTICVLNCINTFFIPESPRWLFSQKRDQEAIGVLNSISKSKDRDKIPLHNDLRLEENSNNSQEDCMEIIEKGPSPLTLLWKNRKDRYHLIIIASFWFVACIMNYLMNFYIKYVPIERIFLMILLAAVAEFISKTLNGILISKMGFTHATQFFQCVCIISAVIYIIFFQRSEFIIIVIFVLKLSASANFASMYFACPTLFESKIAVTAYNLCNISGKIGAVIAPLLAEIPGRWPMIIFLGCSVISFLLICGIKA